MRSFWLEHSIRGCKCQIPKGFDPAASYEGLSLTLRNADGTAVSTVDMPEATLAPGDAQAFAFPDELPLTVGEENFYTIDIRLGEAAGAVRKSVKNLSFSPVKRDRKSVV